MIDRNYWGRLYLSGMSLKDISTQMGVTSATIARELKKQNVTLRPSGGKVTFDPQTAIDLWNQEYTLDQIGEKLGVNRNAIYEQLKKFNINTTRSNLPNIKQLLTDGLIVSQITTQTGNSHNYVCRVARDIGLNEKVVRSRHIQDVISKYTHLSVEDAVKRIVEETGLCKYEIARKYFDVTGEQLHIRTFQSMKPLLEQHREYLLESIALGMRFRDIQRHTKIDARSIKKFIQENELFYDPPTYQISEAAHKRLTNKRWCQAALKRIGRQGGNKITELLNYECCIATVRQYFQNFGLEIARRPIYEYYPQLLDKQWLTEQYDIKPYSEIASDLGVSHPTVRDALIAQGIDISKLSCISKVELQLREFISSIYDGPIIYNDRKAIFPQEIDILLPDLNIGIEFCGIYWHSERYKPNDYHLMKLNNCNKQSIRLIQIFEDEWMFSRTIVENKLKSILCKFQPTCFARNTIIIEQLDYSECAAFLNQNHIQGQDNSSIRIGLTNNNNNLVAVMTFKRYQDGGVELNRFATNGNIPGAFSKLLKHFQKTHSHTYITTFADLRWSSLQSNVYQKHGFEFVHTTKPSYYYYCYKSKQLLHRMKFQRKNLPKMLGDKFNPNLTERQNANNAGYWAIYDCGHAKYILRP